MRRIFNEKTMEKKVLKLSAILFLLVGFIGTSQFNAKMVFNTLNKERVFNVYAAENGYKYEFNEDGRTGVIIVKTDAQEVIILMPQQKMAMKTSAESPMSMGNDPLQAYQNYKNSELLKVVGKETVNGIECVKSILWNKENPTQKMFTLWFSEKYKFPIKIINHIDGIEKSGMEVKDIEPWSPNATSFSIPEGYQIMNLGDATPKH